MNTQIRTLEQLLVPGETQPAAEWQLRAIQSEECLSYVVWNSRTQEALVIDPKREDHDAYKAIATELKDYRWIAVIDTHTHADHVSLAAPLAEELRAPLVMHALSPSPRVHLRVNRTTHLSAQAGEACLLPTPGHTPDSLTVTWGPFLFGGDTILFGDVGRDDLPGGNPEAHYESIKAVLGVARPEMILLPGHDHKGGRASSWATQLKTNASLTQPREEFIREARAFDVPAPRLLKESLRENFK